MPEITESVEAARGCGYRKAGGKYMMGGACEAPCGKLPLVLERCPCCDAGVKPSRSWTWVGARQLFGEEECKVCAQTPGCKLAHPPERAGLLWIGSKHYPTSKEFVDEARRMGISRRLPQVPKDFKVGETLVLLAHRKHEVACPDCDGPAAACPSCKGSGRVHRPAIFGAFTPTHMEYVVKGDETDDDLERLAAQGFKLVRVVRDIDRQGAAL